MYKANAGLQIISEIKASGLRGRGGAGFPSGMKWVCFYQRCGFNFANNLIVIHELQRLGQRHQTPISRRQRR